MNTDIIDKAIAVATAAHKGQTRKGSNLPYIVHPMEAMSIVATESEDQEMLAAAALHDVVEDTGITMDELRAMFGDRVADMVGADNNPPHREGDTWYSRKQEAIDRLAAASRDAQMVAMGDKLSNLRSIANDYKKHGDDLWKRFKAPKGKADLAWYYSGLAKALSPLAATAAHKEFVDLLEKTFINTKA